jgi:hypothetical protein
MSAAAASLVLELCQTFLADREGDVVVIRMFVDESGIHGGSPVISVGGYLSKPTRWQKFTSEWNRVLKPSKIKVFHASECNARSGEFQDWTREERDKLVKRLLPIIPKYAVGMAIGIDLSAVEKVLQSRPDLRQFHRDPYYSCILWLLLRVARRLNEEGDPERIAVVHEINDFQSSALSAYNFVLTQPEGKAYSSFSFGRKQDFVPLQAADILAYEAGRRVPRLNTPERRSLTVLKAGGRTEILSFNAANIQQYVAMLEKLKSQYDAGTLADASKYDPKPTSSASRKSS